MIILPLRASLLAIIATELSQMKYTGIPVINEYSDAFKSETTYR
jgi:hypothetical protein